MATILPSLSSDDEDDVAPRRDPGGRTKKKEGRAGREAVGAAADDDQSDMDDEEEETEMDRGFQFGGILGEDGVMTSLGGNAGPSSSNKTGSAGAGAARWSYQQILQKLEDETATEASKNHPRMDVASLIEAKRKALGNSNIVGGAAGAVATKAARKPKEPTEDDDDQGSTASSSSDQQEGDDDDDGSDSDGKSTSSDSEEEDDASDDGSGSSNDEEGRVGNSKESGKAKKTTKSLPQDVLKTRSGRDQADAAAGSGEDEDDEDSDDDDSPDEDEDAQEAKKAAAFFDQSAIESSLVGGAGVVEVFSQLALSRPLLRGVAAMGFVQPTPIQASVIPVALAGRDVCASAVTGSGKTAAFLLPLLERLLHRVPHAASSSSASSAAARGGRNASIKAVILAPTRELAAQCMAFGSTIGQFTQLRLCLITGGSKNTAAQQAELRTRPDLVIATPGRLLDHVLNSPGVTLEAVEFLVLDEADRLLDLGFQDEVHEIIRHCPVERQTMLFSATMNTKVDELAKLSLKRPVRVRAPATPGGGTASSSSSAALKAKDVELAPRLEQEFVRVRSGNEGVNREGMLLALLTRTFTTQTIVFFDTKVEAHRMMIICGLCGIKCSELHGNLTQPQRLQALDEFRQGNVNVLLASDLACRGLDIDSVQTVINFEMPSNMDTYVHRIGRTARAGRGGRSCTLIGEGRRHLMKDLIRNADAAKKQQNKSGDAGGAAGASAGTGVIRSRTIPPAVVAHFVEKIQGLEPHIEEVLQAEAVARMDRLAEMEAIRAQNIIEHSDEIQSRPQKEWFASKRQKEPTKQSAAEKQKLIEEKVGTGTHRMTRKKRRAREALQALNAPSEMNSKEDRGDADEVRDGGPPARKEIPKVNIKAEARKKKKKDAAKEHEASEWTVHDLDDMRRAAQKKRKASSSAHAAGDGSLFDEDKMNYSSKKKAKDGKITGESAIAKSSFKFDGYDPNRKLGKKRGNKAFKSKSKYKRRK